MALCQVDQFLCWKLKVATLAVCFWIIGSAAVAAFLEILDIAAFGDPNFDIIGGFKAHWRAHVWEGWLATNLVMLCSHLILITYSVLMVFAIKRFPTFYEYHLTRGYLALLIIYFLAELGVACYRYSWYGPNTFRLAYLVFTFLYWLVRSLMNLTCVLIISSRIGEIEYEITYGEKKVINSYSSSANLLDMSMRSGMATPARSGMATPVPRGMAPVHGHMSSSSYA